MTDNKHSDFCDIIVRLPVALVTGIGIGCTHFSFSEDLRKDKIAAAKANAMQCSVDVPAYKSHFYAATPADNAFAACLVGVGMLGLGFVLTGATKRIDEFFANKGQQLANVVRKHYPTI